MIYLFARSVQLGAASAILTPRLITLQNLSARTIGDGVIGWMRQGLYMYITRQSFLLD